MIQSNIDGIKRFHSAELPISRGITSDCLAVLIIINVPAAAEAATAAAASGDALHSNAQNWRQNAG